jgi:hypothetical protein
LVRNKKGAYLGVELVKNVFEVVTFYGFLRVEELEEVLHELWSNVNFK